MEYRKDLVFLVAGACVGAAISLVFQLWQQNSPTSVVVFAGVVLLGLLTIFALSFLGPLRLTLSRSAWARLGGNWEGSFWYEKHGSRVEISEALRITQRGRYVVAQSVSTSISGAFPFKSTGYRLEATLQNDGILTGTWSNTNEGRRYFGAMQATVSRKGNVIEGNWLGIDATGLRQGEFRWTRG